MTRNKTSKAWMREHVTDPFVRRAKQEGLRSRAAFKLREVLERDHLAKPGMLVVDLGAAPGSWSQVIAPLIGPSGQVIAIDIAEMAPIAGVNIIRGDFREDATLLALERALADRPVDLVLSDMAPNISGVAATDQARAAALVELAVDFALTHLKPGGNLLVKAFHGAGMDEVRHRMIAVFDAVRVRKPKASRGRSSEFFILARQRIGLE